MVGASGLRGNQGWGESGMILRFSFPGVPADEVYVTRRLMIGRTLDNDFVIPEERVDRHHAMVDYRSEGEIGQFVVKCLQQEGFLEVDGKHVQEVVLRPGVRFKIGSGEFECLVARERVPVGNERDWSVCPHCGSQESRLLSVGGADCPCCCKEAMLVMDNRNRVHCVVGVCSATGREVMVVWDNQNRRVVLPRQVRSCRLIRLIGQGGMAWVFEGQVEGQGEEVAVKILMPQVLQDEGALERFQREVQALQAVRHRHVLQRLGQGKWKGLPVLLTPLMRQGSLRDAMEEIRARQQKYFQFDVAFRWFQDVLEGLGALHEAHLVHRDLKPSNILLDGEGRAVIADLGIARSLDSRTTYMTATGVGVGTYHYMAPEQMEFGERVDQRVDLYALGVVFYELLTGTLPHGRWSAPSKINPSVPRGFDLVIGRLLEQSPERRFSSVEAVREELVRLKLIAGGPEARSAWTKKTPKAKFLAYALMAFCVGTLAIISIITTWPKNLHRGELVVRTALMYGVSSVAFSPDGRRILTGSGDGTARLWDAETEQELRRFEGHSDRVTSVAFSPDGRRALTGSWDKTARLWDAETGKELRRFEGHSDRVTSVAFSPDGRRVLTGSSDKTARLWDAERGQELRRFEGHSCSVTSVAFSRDGRRVLTGSWDDTARLWNAETGQELRRFEGHSSSVTTVAFSPDGRRVLTGSWDDTARLWDAERGQELRRFEGHSSLVTSVAFSPDGRRVLTASDDKTARLWDAETGQELRRFEGHSAWVTSVVFSPDGRRVLTGSLDNTARLWDSETGQELRRFEGHSDDVDSVAFSPDGRRVLTASDDKTARLWDAETGQELRRFEGHTDRVTSVAFSRDGRRVLTGS
jgi:WD40 repeat protein